MRNETNSKCNAVVSHRPPGSPKPNRDTVPRSSKWIRISISRHLAASILNQWDPGYKPEETCNFFEVDIIYTGLWKHIDILNVASHALTFCRVRINSDSRILSFHLNLLYRNIYCINLSVQEADFSGCSVSSPCLYWTTKLPMYSYRDHRHRFYSRRHVFLKSRLLDCSLRLKAHEDRLPAAENIPCGL